MSTQDTNSLIPQEAKDDLEYMISGFGRLREEVKKTVDESLNLRKSSFDNKTLQGAAEATKKQTQAVDELVVVMSEYKKMQDEIARTQARLNTLESDAAKNLATLKISQQERNAQLKQQAELEKTVSNSIEESRAKVKLLTSERNKLNLATSEGKARLAELNAEIDKNNAFIKDNVDQYTKQKINIGNYSGALTILEAELQRVRKIIEDNTKAGDQNNAMIERWQKEEALLTQLVQGQAAGFASATGELRNNEKALQAMAAAGLQGTESYKLLLAETAQLKDNVSDLKQEIRNLASDTKLLDGAVGTVQALAGAYGIGVAAVQLFGEENQDLQKEMQKLQAVMTIMVGIQQIANALQKESSVVLFLNTVTTKATTAAQWLYTIATNAATSATNAFKAALIGTGLAGILILLSSAAAAMSAHADAIDDDTDSIKKNNEELEKQKQLLKEVTDASEKDRNARKGGLDDLNRELALLKAKGANRKEIFAKEQEIAEVELRNLRVRQASGLDVTKEGLDKANEIAAEKLKFQRESSKKEQEEAKKQADERKKIADEELKFRFEAFKKAKEFEAQQQYDIATDEKVSLEERQEALGKYYELKIRLLNADAEFSIQTGKKTASEIKAINQELSTDLENLSYSILKENNKIADKRLEKEKEVNDKIKADTESREETVRRETKRSEEVQLEAQARLKEAYKQLGDEVISGFGSIVSASYEKQIQQQDRLINNIDLEKEKKINSINAEAGSQEEKTRRIAEVEAQAAHEKEVIEARKRELQRRQAQFEKAASIASIIAKTAEAVIAALKIPIYGEALAAANAAIGAIQLAKVIATPIPQYADETPLGGHPKDGLAIVGEGNKAEVVTTKDGSFIADRAMLVGLKKGDTVKHLDRYTDSLLNLQLVQRPKDAIDISKAFDKHTDKVMHGLKQVAHAIDRKPVPNFNVIGGSWSNYVNNNL
jgi:hypothetical protein